MRNPTADEQKELGISRGVRAAVRGVTSPLRPLPSVLLVGGIRCGSTSLHEHLVRSGLSGPMPPQRKEIHFFDRSYDRGPSWYRRRFAIRSALAIDSTPSYLCTPGVAERAQELLPRAKVIAVLRDPRRRTVSHFEWRRSRGVEPLEHLEDALEDEPNRMTDGLTMLGCYDLHSRYDVALQRWRQVFGEDQVCVLVAERLFGGDADELRRCERFLGLQLRGTMPHSNVGRQASVPHHLGRRYRDVIANVEDVIGRSTGWDESSI